MVRYLIVLTLMLVGVGQILAQTTANLRGRVIDPTDEPVMFANIQLQKGEEMIAGGQTDMDGNYYIANVPAGKYDLVVSYVGFATLKITGVQLTAGQLVERDVKFENTGVDLGEVIVIPDPTPIVAVDNTTSTLTLTSEDIAKRATRNPTDLKAQKTGVVQKDAGESTNTAGSRSTSDDTYVDGVRVFGSASVPETEIEQIQIITSGIPAEYGDATGAITNIITKGPANEFTGGVQLETSQYLDPFGSNRADLSFAGPILRTPVKDAKGDTSKGKDGKPNMRTMLGYRFAATYSTTQDERPSALSSYKLKDDVLDRLNQNPLVKNPVGGGSVLATDYLTKDDFVTTKLMPNARESYTVLNGKFDFKPTNDLFISVGGQGQFNWGKNASTADRLFNSEYNPYYRTSSIRTYGRLRHTIASTTVDTKKEEDETKNDTAFVKAKTFQNLVYEVQLDYTNNSSFSADPRYDDRLFEYGYVGKIFRSLSPVVSAVDSVPIRNSQDSIIGYDVRMGHSSNFIQFNGYEAATDINPVLSAYNNLIDFNNITTMEQMEVVNGRFTGNRYSVFGLYSNVGCAGCLSGGLGNSYGKSNSVQLRGNFKVNFDLVTNQGKGKSPIRHAIQLGGVYEQRIERSYAINPFGLWTLADQSANDHLSLTADRTRPLGETFFDASTQRYYERFDLTIRNDEEGNPVRMSAFGERLRQQLGKGERDWINVHELAPSQLALNMFEPTTLIQGNQAVMSYYGYDYLGNPLGTNVQFNDFFTEVDADGRKTRPIAPVKPIYMAGYIQDKFQYKDIIVRAGVRFDSYDANTKVLKDPFSIAGYYTAKEFENKNSSPYTVVQTDYTRPTNIGDDYAVYVNDNSPDATVVGYRSGEQWYDKNGTPVNTARELGSNVVPALRGFSSAVNDPQGSNYNPDNAFRDYKPTLIIMPRLSFSFPIIKDMANFYANYDVLSQRPPVATVATPLTYFNFRENAAAANSYIANPNLTSQRVINYEVGYQQALNKFSRVKLAMLYREERNLIQIKQYLYAYPIQYTSFGNDDFSTTKSFMFEYELRPKKRGTENKQSNMTLMANYTLMFAEGTGSSPTSSATVAATDLKYVFPLDFDQRHTFFFNFDYRYKDGKEYNGPTLKAGKGGKNIDLLANTGINLSLTAFSGSPYTRKQIPGGLGTNFQAGVTEGSINGARMPWSYRVDLRIDRNVTIGGKAKGEGKTGKAIRANIYLRVQNLLNTQNVLNVYQATGSPTDDGFLTMQNSPGLGLLSLYADSYSTLYSYRMNSPYNISRPRRIFLGVVFQF